jgi:DNA/RNA endonuclease YhcR with UshA esterase domain
LKQLGVKRLRWIIIKIVVLLIFNFPGALAYAALPTYSWNEAHEHIGEQAVVAGVIEYTKNTGKVCYLNFHRDYNRFISLVIFPQNFNKFQSPPEEYFKGKKVQVTGKISEYRSRPQIIIHDPDQIRILGIDSAIEKPKTSINSTTEKQEAPYIKEINWDVAANYYGAYVKVKGKIVRTHNSGKACFLNFHNNFTKYLTVVIFANDFPKFPEKPEKFYLNKTVSVKGKIKEYKGKPEIIIKNPSNIKITSPPDTVIKTPPNPIRAKNQLPHNNQKADVPQTPSRTNGILKKLIIFFVIVLVTAIIIIKSIRPKTSEQDSIQIPIKPDDSIKDLVEEKVESAVKREFERQKREIDDLLIKVNEIENNPHDEEEIKAIGKKYDGHFIYREDIRAKLELALSTAKGEIDIISPWLSENAINEKLIAMMEKALQKGVTIKIIYGYEGGILETKSQEIANRLKLIYRNYRETFKIRRINTHEKLLICDESFFMIGSYNLLSFGGRFDSNTRDEIMLFSKESNLIRSLRKKHFNF